MPLDATVYSSVWSGVYQRKHQRSVLLAICEGNPRVLVGSTDKGPCNAENASL